MMHSVQAHLTRSLLCFSALEPHCVVLALAMRDMQHHLRLRKRTRAFLRLRQRQSDEDKGHVKGQRIL